MVKGYRGTHGHVVIPYRNLIFETSRKIKIKPDISVLKPDSESTGKSNTV